jgi:hypothetical protein
VKDFCIVIMGDHCLMTEKGPGPGSLVDIAASILKTTSGMQKWSISDLTLGLYLLSVRHATNMAGDTFAGDPVASDYLVLYLPGHLNEFCCCSFIAKF